MTSRITGNGDRIGHPARSKRIFPRAAAVGLAALGLIAPLALVGASTTPAVAADTRPTAVVSMGDSYISGESAGDYEPGTDQKGNFCHRSKKALINQLEINVDKRVNLACSGAKTNNMYLGGDALYGEKPQVDQLRKVATDNNVKMIAVNVGGNDAKFIPIVLDCIKAFFKIGPRCQDTWASKLPGELAAAKPNITRTVADIRSVMKDAGYADDGYQLVIQSYPSVVTGDNRYGGILGGAQKLLNGCPIRDDDAAWAKSVVVQQFAATLGQVATEQKARFLSMPAAFNGKEVCAKGISGNQEWGSGITIDVQQILKGLGSNIVQQSLHPNARGHVQFARCLSKFATTTDPSATCVAGSDGNLEPRVGNPAAMSKSVPSRTLAVVNEAPGPPNREAALQLIAKYSKQPTGN